MSEIHCTECWKTEFVQCNSSRCRYRNSVGSFVWPVINSNQSGIATKTTQLYNLHRDKVFTLFGSGRVKALNSFLSNKRGKRNINQLAYENDPLIIWACKNGHRSVVQLLLHHGADPNTRCQDGMTALGHALHGNCTHVIDMLVKFGCDVNEQINGCTYLDRAVMLYKPKMVKSLLHWGADPNVRSSGIPPALFHVNPMNSLKILELLLSHGAKVEALTRGRTTLATHFIISDRLDLLQLLVERAGLEHCEKHEQDHAGRSLLHVASCRTSTACLSYLLSCGLDVEALEKRNGGTALHVAAGNSGASGQTCRLLLSYGARVDAADRSGNTALHLAVINQKSKAVKYLLMAGAQIGRQNYAKLTPAEYAVLCDNVSSLELLLLFGADMRKVQKLVTDQKKHEKVRARLARYIVMRKAVWMTDEQLNRESDCNEFKEQCRAELGRIKAFKLFNGTSCFALLRRTRRGLVALVRSRRGKSQTLMRLYNCRLAHEFPIYSLLLWKKIFDGQEYAPVFAKAMQSFNEICDSYFPSLVVEKIMNYLSVEDMKSIIDTSLPQDMSSRCRKKRKRRREDELLLS